MIFLMNLTHFKNPRKKKKNLEVTEIKYVIKTKQLNVKKRKEDNYQG